MESARRLLSCLDYPFWETVNLSSPTERIHLITWLEDIKIRHLAREEREVLRKHDERWNSSFSKYLKELDCPFIWSEDSIDCIIWLINHAISLVYLDCDESGLEALNDQGHNEIKEEDCSAPTIFSGVDNIGSLLGMPRLERESNPDYLQRISKVVRLILTPGSLDCLLTNNAKGIQLEEFPLGFSTGDEDTNKIAIVLKMLYLSDFREMQNDLNALVVLGQDYTANPRTNTSLGKVGR